LEGSPTYYPRLGFRAGAELGFRKPSLRIPDAAFQVMPLGAYEPWMTCTLVYAEDVLAVRRRGPARRLIYRPETASAFRAMADYVIRTEDVARPAIAAPARRCAGPEG
jgi:hypothetical protein